MKRRPGIIAALSLGALSGYFAWAYSATREGIDPENDFANWKPGAAAIRSSLPNGSPRQREAAFARLFQHRFRDHDPGKAVGVRFAPDGLHLLTPARMEPWNVDRLALMAYREASEDLSKVYTVQIYETFIGMPPVKIGELHPSAKTPQQVYVSYHYPEGGRVRFRPATGPSVPLRPAEFGVPIAPRMAPTRPL